MPRAAKAARSPSRAPAKPAGKEVAADTTTLEPAALAGEPPRSHVEKAYQALKRMVLGNELGPGTQLLELEVAARLGMSRTPVREAMIRLSRDGLVEIRPRHGMRVLPISADDMREIYDVLTALEATAAELAARRRPADSELQPMEQAIRDMDAALAREDLEGWAEADDRFHAALLEVSGNRRLVDLVNLYRDQAHRARIATLKLRPKPVDSNRDHTTVLQAIRAGDADTAYTMHRDHRRKSGAMLVGLLRDLGLRRV